MTVVASTPSTAASRVALAALIIGNLLVAALALRHRNAYQILMFAFWLEFVAVAVINVPKMLIAAAFGQPITNLEDLSDAGNRVLTVLLMLVFYVVVLAFIAMVSYALLGLVPWALRAVPGGSLFALPARAGSDAGSVYWIIAAIVVGHALSFFINFLGRREFRQASLLMLALQPFLRLALTALVMVVALGAALAQPLVASTTLFAVLLAAFKLVADIVGHLQERRRFAPRGDPVAGVAVA